MKILRSAQVQDQFTHQQLVDPDVDINVLTNALCKKRRREMRRIILLSTVLLATPFGMESYAADCATTSCQTLGYTATSNKGNCLQCPFGNYWFCPESQCDSSYKYTCTGYMQSPSGTACNGKYRKCNCSSNNYVWNASQGLCLECEEVCIKYDVIVDYECRFIAGSYQLYLINHPFHLQNDGSYKEDTGSVGSAYYGKYDTLTACQNEANNHQDKIGSKICADYRCK